MLTDRPRGAALLRSGLALIVFVLGLPAGRAAGTPVVDLSWDACAPVVSAKSPGPGQTLSTLYCSVLGMDQPTRGYRVDLWYAGEMPCRTAPSTPDAWRFDAAGCQGEQITQIRTTSTSKTCPALAGTAPTVTILKMEYSPDDGSTPSGAMRVTVAVGYPGGAPAPDPGQRSQLFKIEFEHLFSVAGPGTPGETCGGYETPMCFALWNGTDTVMGECWGLFARGWSLHYVGTNGIEQAFAPGQSFASFGLGESHFSCFEVTPARAATWGGIKAQYR